MKLIPLFTLVVTLLFSVQLFSQNKKDWSEDEILVKLHKEVELESFLKDVNQRYQGSFSLSVKRATAPNWNIYLFQISKAKIPSLEILGNLKKHQMVKAAGYNKSVYPRLEPDDLDYGRQWGLNKIEIEAVWDLTTGGVSKNGDTLVIAILDSGFDTTHPDLSNNLWKNKEEIPGDNLDNDGNGLIDDVFGYNFQFDSPIFSKGFHGLAVAGIAGAEGNNGTFISGVNWNIQLMYLQVNSFESVAAAYYYVVNQKRKYLDTNGEKGANVVVTNFSQGADGDCLGTDILAWFNEPMDSLGKVGVLSVNSTDNKTKDVDQVGDIPSSCPSDYMITVTNTDKMDLLNSAGFGRTTIDLGAPGTAIYTLGLDTTANSNFTGCSASAPHVAGTIALLYSLPCNKLAENAITEPEATARSMKSFIMNGVDPINSLQNRTVTGGRLNARKSMELALLYCNIASGPLEILEVFPNPTYGDLTINFSSPDNKPYNLRIFNSIGDLMLEQNFELGEFEEKQKLLNISHLASGAYYLTLAQDGEISTVPIFKK
ncbi:MAG: S8 family serine peptidase [Saprospiraceae bacterium]